MATPMQYEVIGRLLAMKLRSPEFITRLNPDRDAGLRDAEKADQVRQMQQSILANVPLVDCTDVWQVISPTTDTQNGGIGLDPERYNEVMRPVFGATEIEVPWPLAVISCYFHHSQRIAIWMLKDGKIVPTIITLIDGELCHITHDPAYEHQHNSHFLTDKFTAVTTAMLALASAKNSNWVESAPNRATRRRNPTIAGIRFRHIEIDMGKAKRKAEAHEPESHGAPWHHRRGHWAYVTPDRPLFGRKGEHGWYWKPYTEVGDKAHGEIVQDYSVKAPRAAA